MTTQRRRAGGFTLIELLVVIGLLATFAALAAGTYFRIRTAQQEKATGEVLVRFSTAVERFVKASNDQARQDIREDRPGAAVAVRLSQLWVNPSAANPPGEPDRDRAAAVWTYLRLKAELPQTFDEAALGVGGHLPVAPTGVPGGYTTVVAAKPSYQQVVGFTAVNASTWTWNQLLRNKPADTRRDYALESAALLYQILTERGVRGELAGDEIGGTQQTEVELATTEYQRVTFNPLNGQFGATSVPTAPLKVKVFKDLLGTPITFVRFAQNFDIITTNPNGGAPVDPFDPQGLLRTVNPTTGAPAEWGDGTPNGKAANVFRLAFHDLLRYRPVFPQTNAYTPPLPVLPDPAGTRRWVTTLLAASNERTNRSDPNRSRKWDALNDAIEAAVAGGSPMVELPKDTAYLYSYNSR